MTLHTILQVKFITFSPIYAELVVQILEYYLLFPYTNITNILELYFFGATTVLPIDFPVLLPPFINVDFVPPILSLPGLIILEAGGLVGGKALVTVNPIKTPLTLRPPFFLNIIFKLVGLVIFKKYYGLRHQN